ncbi:MAG: hypothetical protein Q6K70_06075, partial [Thermostichales cyanobacterium DRC_bins_46]
GSEFIDAFNNCLALCAAFVDCLDLQLALAIFQRYIFGIPSLEVEASEESVPVSTEELGDRVRRHKPLGEADYKSKSTKGPSNLSMMSQDTLNA